MTIKEAVAADLGKSNVERVSQFTKAFRIDELSNIEVGESFTIPTGDDYIILSQRMMRGGQPVLDRDNKPVTAEELESIKSKNGRIVEFSGSLAAGLLGALAGMGAGFVAIVLEVLNPWVLIKQVGNTLTYAAKGTMGFVTSFIAGAFVILAVLVIVLWGAFFLPIIGMFVLPACGIIRFLINSYKYKDGPKTI